MLFSATEHTVQYDAPTGDWEMSGVGDCLEGSEAPWGGERTSRVCCLCLTRTLHRLLASTARSPPTPVGATAARLRARMAPVRRRILVRLPWSRAGAVAFEPTTGWRGV